MRVRTRVHVGDGERLVVRRSTPLPSCALITPFTRRSGIELCPVRPSFMAPVTDVFEEPGVLSVRQVRHSRLKRWVRV